MVIKKASKEERERLRKLLAENPRLIHPTGKRDTSPFEPIEIRGEPLSQTIIEERRQAALLYLDTSALAKVYVRERGSERMAELISEDADHGLAICAITQVEFHSVISRRRREGDLDDDEVKRAAERFDNHFRNVFERCPVDDRTLNLASAIVARHVLRASDAIQLAACLTLIDDLTLSGEARGR